MDQPRRRWALNPDPLDGEERPTVEGVVRELRRVPLARLLATALIVAWAILFARYSWEAPASVDAQGRYHFPARTAEPKAAIPIATDTERALYDLRRWWVPQPTGQDRRILLVPYLQETLAATSKRSPLDRAILARALANIDKMGAKAIGIDILIDQPQPEDAQLLATLKAMKTPVWLAYATQSDSDTEVEDWQQQFMDGWFRQLAGSQVRPTSVRFEPDGDNVQRRWPSLPAGLPPLMPLALSNLPALQYQGSIDFQLPANREFKVFNSLQIDRFADPAFASLLGGEVKARICLLYTSDAADE